MTTERFDIEVRDGVAKTIRAELTAIGTAARGTHSVVQQLNRELASGTRAAAASAQTAAQQAASAAGNSAAAQARATAETARAVAAQTRLTTEQTKAGIAAERLAQAESKTALAKQKVATEAARTAEAQSRANIAYLREEEALNKAVSAEQRAIGRKQQLKAATDALTASEEREILVHDRAASRPAVNSTLGGYGGSRSLTASQTNGMRGGGSGGVPEELLLTPAMAATVVSAGRTIQASHTQTLTGLSSLSKMSNNARIAMLDMTHVGINSAQMLASGVDPLRVLVMESGRLATAVQYSDGSIKKLLGDTATWIGLIKRTGDAELDAAAASAAATAAAIAGREAQAASNVLNAETEVALAAAQQRTAATATEEAAASARLTAANEALAAANAEAAVATEALATAQAQSAEAGAASQAASRTALGATGATAIAAAAALGLVVAGVMALDHEASKNAGLKTYTKEMGYTASEVKKLNAVSVGFGDTVKAVFQVGAQRAFGVFGAKAKDVASAWNKVLDNMATATRVVLGGIYAGMLGFAYGMRNIIKNIGDGKSNDNPFTNIKDGFKGAYSDAQKFFDDVVKGAQKNARDRQQTMASDMHNDKKGPKGKQPWDRAKEWRDAHAELDVTIGMLDKYGEALERAQQIEQIARTFREHNVPLTAAEVDILDKKIQKIQDGKRVQEAMTAAEEAANGPLRTLTAQEDALDKLLDKGAISAAEHKRQMNLATRAYEDATDPLAALNRELAKNGELMGYYGKSRDVQAYIQSLETAAQAQGRTIYEYAPRQDTGPGGDIIVNGRRRLSKQAQGMVDEFRSQQNQGDYTRAFEAIDPRQNQDPTNSSYLLDHYKELYAEIDRFRQQDVANEEEANERKKNLDTALMDAKLENTSKMFGQLASLQNSKNRQLAAIGKAAAIAEATIDGIMAVQKALKGPPGPPWSFAIAGVTAAMTAVNVAKIAGVKGFQVGGYTGDGAPGTIAGMVHGREYVFDESATRRIGVPALDALRSGAQLTRPGSNDNGAPRVTIRPQPGVYMEEVSTSDDHIELIAARVVKRDAAKHVAEDVRRGANSATGKAMTSAYGVRRVDR